MAMSTFGSSYAAADNRQSAETIADSALNNNTTVNQGPVETVKNNQTGTQNGVQNTSVKESSVNSTVQVLSTQNTVNSTLNVSSNSQNSANNIKNTQNAVQTAEANHQNSVSTAAEAVNNTTNSQISENQGFSDPQIKNLQALENQGFSDPQIKNLQAAAGTTKTTALTSIKFNLSQINDAAAKIKSYVESNHKLPNYVTIGTTQVTMPEFLKLMVTGLLQINNKTTTSIALNPVDNPQNSTGSFTKGNINKAGYLDIAKRIQSFINSNGLAPNYATTNLGKVQYEQLVYMFSKILNYYKTNKVLPNYVSMDPGVKVASSTNTGVPAAPAFTVDQIKSAATSVKSYIESNHALPGYVAIGTVQVKMTDFLRLLIMGTLEINNGSKAQISLKTIAAPSKPSETITSGNITLASYIDLANRVKAFIDSNGTLPNYATTSLGEIGYESMIYMYSKILSYDSTNGRLPNYVSVNSWSSVSTVQVPAELQQYLKVTKNCEVTNSQIQALAKSITSGKTSTYDKAVAIFNWVRDKIGYSFYYNTKYGAVGTLNAKTGNCVDTSHLLIALERAAGIPARYEHVKGQFTSGTWYGHVIAQVWVNGKWYNADATSSSNTFGVIKNWNTATATYYGTYAELPF